MQTPYLQSAEAKQFVFEDEALWETENVSPPVSASFCYFILWTHSVLFFCSFSCLKGSVLDICTSTSVLMFKTKNWKLFYLKSAWMEYCYVTGGCSSHNTPFSRWRSQVGFCHKHAFSVFQLQQSSNLCEGRSLDCSMLWVGTEWQEKAGGCPQHVHQSEV